MLFNAIYEFLRHNFMPLIDTDIQRTSSDLSVALGFYPLHPRHRHERVHTVLFSSRNECHLFSFKRNYNCAIRVGFKKRKIDKSASRSKSNEADDAAEEV